MSRWVPHAVMLAVILAWSGAFAMIKVALEELSALDLTLLRFLIPLPLFLVVLAVTGVPRFERAEWPRVILVAVLSVGGYHLALNFGETAISAGVAALMVATGPIWTALLSSIVLRERVTLQKAGGIAVALAGVVVIVLGQGADLDVRYVLGALLALTAPMMWAASSVASKPLLARHEPLAFTAVATLLGTVLLLPIAATGTPARALDASAWTWAALLHLGLLATFAGYVGFNYALRELSATETMAYVYLNPFFALGWARLLTPQPITAFILAGGALVIAGVALTNWPTRSRTKAVPPASTVMTDAGRDE